jgi:endonuclease/exonuclease/phosphatase family metal-dependent hydrolase
MRPHNAPTLLAALLISSCAFDVGEDDLEEGDPGPLTAAVTDSPADTRSRDEPETLEIGSWNLEWLGAPDRGPTDEELQVENAALVLRTTDLDVIGLVEVVSAASFDELLDRLPGYHGLLVSDPRVDGGAASYGDDEQKVALIVRDRFQITAARVILHEESWSFAGRPPLEVSLSFTEGGRPRTLEVVVAHFKAMANADGYQRRSRAAAALQQWLAAEHPRDWALVVGDFNDDLDRSTYRGLTSPFASLLFDPALRFTTLELTEAGEPTTVSFSSTIDHHLATASLARRFLEGSAEVLHPEGWVAGFGETTSDHYPVLTRYDVR